ncbi:MAG: hypothetical protein WBG86_23210, partial [Polyangiales bacterium]
GTAGAGGTAGMGGVSGMGGAGGVSGVSGMGGGGTGGDPCAPSGTVSFTSSGPGAEPDCIVPGVCIDRARVKALFNAATERAANNAVSPEGTLWALSTCAAATEPDDFGLFTRLFTSSGGGGIGNNIIEASLCLWLTNEDLKYDVVFSAWGSVVDSNFAYERTNVDDDACGVAGATCDTSCTCPSGWVNQDGDGICVLPDPCDPNPCGAGATCRKIGATSHRCECDTVEFTKPPGETGTTDCVNPGVCIARGDGRALYNAIEENEAAASGVCELDIGSRPAFPTLTEWARMPCASAVPDDFVIFLDDAFACRGVPSQVIGFQSCLSTTNDNDFWDIEFIDWCPSAQTNPDKGCFSYVRWHAVDDGEACVLDVDP